MTDRQVGALRLQVDVRLPLTPTPQVGALGTGIDVSVPRVDESRVGRLGLSVDVAVPPGVQVATLGLMVDYVASAIPTNAARWSGSVFDLGTASPVVRWSGSAFETAGTNPMVIWNVDHFEMSP